MSHMKRCLELVEEMKEMMAEHLVFGWTIHSLDQDWLQNEAFAIYAKHMRDENLGMDEYQRYDILSCWAMGVIKNMVPHESGTYPDHMMVLRRGYKNKHHQSFLELDLGNVLLSIAQPRTVDKMKEYGWNGEPILLKNGHPIEIQEPPLVILGQGTSKIHYKPE